MLDCMSGGRLVAGLMRGIPHEYIAYNIPPDESWSRQREAIALILKAWTEPEPFGWEGEHFQFRQVSIWPQPAAEAAPAARGLGEQPGVGRASPGEMRATMGMVLSPTSRVAKECIQRLPARQRARRAGSRPPDHILIGMHTVIAESDDEASAALRRSAQATSTAC